MVVEAAGVPVRVGSAGVRDRPPTRTWGMSASYRVGVLRYYGHLQVTARYGGSSVPPYTVVVQQGTHTCTCAAYLHTKLVGLPVISVLIMGNFLIKPPPYIF